METIYKFILRLKIVFISRSTRSLSSSKQKSRVILPNFIKIYPVVVEIWH